MAAKTLYVWATENKLFFLPYYVQNYTSPSSSWLNNVLYCATEFDALSKRASLWHLLHESGIFPNEFCWSPVLFHSFPMAVGDNKQDSLVLQFWECSKFADESLCKDRNQIKKKKKERNTSVYMCTQSRKKLFQCLENEKEIDSPV